MQLRTTIIKQAGPQVEQELAGEDFTKNIVHTSAGQLKQAKRLLFIPWTPPTAYFNNQDVRALDQSIATFVQCAIEYAVLRKSKSIGKYAPCDFVKPFDRFQHFPPLVAAVLGYLPMSSRRA